MNIISQNNSAQGYQKITIQLSLQNKQEIQISARHALQNVVAMATSDSITYTSLECQINLRKSLMVWKHHLKLSEIASYSKLARASKPPPPPPRRNRVKFVT